MVRKLQHGFERIKWQGGLPAFAGRQETMCTSPDSTSDKHGPGTETHPALALFMVNYDTNVPWGHGRHDTELWATDGTTAGTRLVKDINPGVSSPRYVSKIVDLGTGTALFVMYQGAGRSELWATDGTTAGTRMVRNVNPSTSEASLSSTLGDSGDNIVPLDNGTALVEVWHCNGTELWATNGTACGTHPVKIINQYPFPKSAHLAPVSGGRALFWNQEGGHDARPWITDGTAAGTHVVVQAPDYIPHPIEENRPPGVRPTIDFGGDSDFIPLGNGTALFWMTDGVHGWEPWASDRTTAGAHMLADIWPGTVGSLPMSFQLVGSRTLFWADDPTDGFTPWVSDGTGAGTHRLADIARTSDFITPDFIPIGNGLVLFNGEEPTGKVQTWVSDGTSAGTHLLKGTQSGASVPYNDTAVPSLAPGALH
ncbi:conserved protein of unknown function [Rhodovastum atsumiense]|uniref:Uncharacterized protein n=1 Tax=Rhodovastum atsumiense TaxID=504468 RepID=A0A5M6IXV2_9PROT|nr:hypothetical protein [Rhodovastum atsumiense]KAA5612789.1 hypothetical protein F1189_08620 [Rhodovastum atsumiense]CAH2602630.1 conserved protein of unknown function [Rhodovastum atsumiense]